MSSATISKNDYQVGIITALPIERAAITAMLDVVHQMPDDFIQVSRDQNCYTWGRMAYHNVVIASLSAGVYGNTMATTTAMDMLWSFPSIKFGLMVGIGGGVPAQDIRLGDVVVSQPNGITGGVFQYDLGKAKHNEWERRDFLARPPDILLKALSKLQTEHEFQSPRAHEYLNTAAIKHKYWGTMYARPGIDDRLFSSSYIHQPQSSRGTCSACDARQIIERPYRSMHVNFNIHYGTIASGNSLVKDAKLRDWIASREQECFCIEMEAAGLMNNFPCLVIRGICDYADSHKNDAWQRYACATAAAFAKELLSFVPSSDPRAASEALKILRASGSDQFTEAMRPRNESQQARNDSRFHGSATNDDEITMANLASGLDTTRISDSDQTRLSGRATTNARSAEEDNTLLHPVYADTEAENQQLTPVAISAKEVAIAAKEGNLETVRLWNECSIKNHDGGMLLHIAAYNGNLDVVRYLVEHNASINAKDISGYTPLHNAACNGYLDVIAYLVDNNANIDAMANDGDTPLHCGACYGYVDVVEYLVGRGANIDARASNGATPLCSAADSGRLHVSKYLLKHKANVDGSANCRYTPLQIASLYGHIGVARILLEHHADTRKRCAYGTALEIAKRKGHRKIVELINAHEFNAYTRQKSFLEAQASLDKVREEEHSKWKRYQEKASRGIFGRKKKT